MFFVNDYGVGKTLKKTVEMREKFYISKTSYNTIQTSKNPTFHIFKSHIKTV